MFDFFENFIKVTAAVKAAQASNGVGRKIRHTQQQLFAVFDSGLLDIIKNAHACGGFKELAQIFFGQAAKAGDIIEIDGLPVMLFNIGDYRGDSLGLAKAGRI